MNRHSLQYYSAQPKETFHILGNVVTGSSKPPRPTHSFGLGDKVENLMHTNDAYYHPDRNNNWINISTPSAPPTELVLGIEKSSGISSYQSFNPTAVSMVTQAAPRIDVDEVNAPVRGDYQEYVTTGGYRYGQPNAIIIDISATEAQEISTVTVPPVVATNICCEETISGNSTIASDKSKNQKIPQISKVNSPTTSSLHKHENVGRNVSKPTMHIDSYDYGCDAFGRTDFMPYSTAKDCHHNGSNLYYNQFGNYPEDKPRWNYSPKLASLDQTIQYPVDASGSRRLNLESSRWSLTPQLMSHTNNVSRVCVAAWPVEQAFRSNGMQLDLQSSTVQLFDCEQIEEEFSSKSVSQGNAMFCTKQQHFHFNELLSGTAAMTRLHSLYLFRLRQALQLQRNLVFLLHGTGIGAPKEAELSVQTMLGSVSFGSMADTSPQTDGVIAVVLKDLFKLLYPLSFQYANLEDLGDPTMNSLAGSNNCRQQSKFLRERSSARVVMSAFVIKNDQLVDLLACSELSNFVEELVTNGSDAPKCSRKYRKENECYIKTSAADGAAHIRRAVRVQINHINDFQRIVGVLIGRRTAMADIICRSLSQHLVLKSLTTAKLFTTAEGAWIAPIDSKLLADLKRVDAEVLKQNLEENTESPSKMGNGTSKHAFDAETIRKSGKKHHKRSQHRFSSRSFAESTAMQIPDSSGTLLFQFSVDYPKNAGISKKQNQIQLSFLCPCGTNWMKPDPSLQIFSESLNSVPHPATPTALQLSVLSQLFLNPIAAPSTDFMCTLNLRPPQQSHDPLASRRGSHSLRSYAGNSRPSISRENISNAFRLMCL